MDYVLRGSKMVFGDRRLRRYLVKPLLWTLLIYAVISISASFAISGPIANMLERFGMSDAWSPWIGRLVFFIAWSFVAGSVFFGVNGILSSLLWEELSLHAEQDAFGSAPNHPTTLGAAWADTFRRIPITFGVSLLAFFLSICGLGWVSVWPVGWLCLYDFTAPAFARRNVYYPRQKLAAKQLKKAINFALTCGVIGLFPLINLIMLPGCIVGATLLVRDSEKSVVE